MLRFTLILLFLSISIVPNDNELAWDENYRLQWTDFRGAPDLTSDAVAITASGLSSNFSARTTATRLVDYSANITAHFYPDKSWYRPGKVNEIVLAHEQLHFDITELHARKLRKAIEEYNFTLDIKKEMRLLQDKINAELAALQEQYDNDTNFSMNVENQKQWQIRIKNALDALSEYQ